jgi:hypothetical protein
LRDAIVNAGPLIVGDGGSGALATDSGTAFGPISGPVVWHEGTRLHSPTPSAMTHSGRTFRCSIAAFPRAPNIFRAEAGHHSEGRNAVKSNFGCDSEEKWLARRASEVRESRKTAKIVGF